jgi:H+/Cl- antiporter ClcA
MLNKLYRINKKGLRIVPVPANSEELSPSAALPRVVYLSLAAIVVAAAGAAIGWLISTALEALKERYYDVNGDDAGMLIILIPVAGALLLTWLSRYASPFFHAIGITVAIGAGAPLGIETPAMIFNGALGKWMGKLFRGTPEECHILFVAGTCSILGSAFGAPIAAVFLALEIFLSVFTLYNILPVICAAATAGLASYMLRGTTPVYTMEALPAILPKSLLAYIGIGLIIGLWARLVVKLYTLIDKWFGKLTIQSRWHMLGGALMVGVAGYISPRALGTGNHYINDLLQAHVTLSILFALAIIKLLAWLFFSGAYKTGTGITPLLMMGGAAGLLAGVLIQLVFPSLVIHSGTLVLAGMGAMLAGTSRAVLTTAVLSWELTHNTNAALPVLAACIIAYSVAAYSRKRAQSS